MNNHARSTQNACRPAHSGALLTAANAPYDPAIDPRTFLPPKPTDVADPPAIGDQAPPLFGDAAPTGPLVVAFLRHAGCPFAEWTGKEMRVMAAVFGDVGFVAVSHADEAATEQWCEAVGGLDGVRVEIDPDRSEYAAWGLGRTGLAHFAGAKSLTGVAKLAREGIRNRHPVGTRWQQAGTFSVAASGRVTWRHLPDHAGDLPDLGAAAVAAQA